MFPVCLISVQVGSHIWCVDDGCYSCAVLLIWGNYPVARISFTAVDTEDMCHFRCSRSRKCNFYASGSNLWFIRAVVQISIHYILYLVRCFGRYIRRNSTVLIWKLVLRISESDIKLSCEDSEGCACWRIQFQPRVRRKLHIKSFFLLFSIVILPHFIYQYTVYFEHEDVIGVMRRSSPAPNLLRDIASLRKRFRLGAIFLIFQVEPTGWANCLDTLLVCTVRL